MGPLSYLVQMTDAGSVPRSTSVSHHYPLVFQKSLEYYYRENIELNHPEDYE